MSVESWGDSTVPPGLRGGQIRRGQPPHNSLTSQHLSGGRVLGPYGVLKAGGSWAVGDLIFDGEEAEKAALSRYKWLEAEYFARIEDLLPLLAAVGTELNTSQFTPVTWILWATKPT